MCVCSGKRGQGVDERKQQDESDSGTSLERKRSLRLLGAIRFNANGAITHKKLKVKAGMKVIHFIDATEYDTTPRIGCMLEEESVCFRWVGSIEHEKFMTTTASDRVCVLRKQSLILIFFFRVAFCFVR